MSAPGIANTLVWLLVIIIIIIVIVLLLRFLFGVFFIAPIVSATPAAYTETVGLVSLLSVGLSQSLIADTSHFFNL